MLNTEYLLNDHRTMNTECNFSCVFAAYTDMSLLVNRCVREVDMAVCDWVMVAV